MGKTTKNRILNHPDFEELICKFQLSISESDINEWLSYKYTNVNEAKFVISVKNLKEFKDDYLDVYTRAQKDISKFKSGTDLNTTTTDSLEVAVNGSEAYQQMIKKAANEEFDVRKTVKTLCVAIETRLGQVFDEIQNDPRSITRYRLLIEYCEVFGNILEKYYKFTEIPVEQTVNYNHNISIQVDQHIAVFHDIIKSILAQLDLESSLMFMELFNQKMAKLKMPDPNVLTSTEKLAEAKLLNEQIIERING